MGQSLCHLCVHLTFSTKSRIPFIHSKINKELHIYMADQQIHHQTTTSRQDTDRVMQECDGIEYDPDHFWR